MWSPRMVNKIFPSLRNTNRWKIRLANFSFRNQSEENGFGVAMAIFPIANKIRTEKSRQTNHAGHISSFVELQNVSSQLYTFSCAQLKNCRLVLCYVQSDLSFRVLSRRSTDRHVAPCCSHQATTVQHFSSQSPESSAKRTLWETAKNKRREGFPPGHFKSVGWPFSALLRTVRNSMKSCGKRHEHRFYTSKAVSDQFSGRL